jgi:hypothetical protein
MKFEKGDLVRLSQAGITLGKERCSLPKNRVGRIRGVECGPSAYGPAIYVVDFDGSGIFLTETLLEEVGPLDLLADITKDDRAYDL